MLTICKNCSGVFEGNYCPGCGQKSKTERIDLAYVQDEIKYTFFHINGGFFYTLKELLTRPGHMIREFIEGRRVRHYKPILLLVVLAGLYGFLLHYIDLNKLLDSANDKVGPVDMGKLVTWMRSHYSLAEIIYLPLITLSSWLAFKGWGYNFIEHLVLNAYIASLRLLVSMLFYPFMLLFDSATAYIIISGLLSSVTILITGWAYCQFFDQRPLGPTILRTLLMTFLVFAISMLISIIATIIYMVMLTD